MFYNIGPRLKLHLAYKQANFADQIVFRLLNLEATPAVVVVQW